MKLHRLNAHIVINLEQITACVSQPDVNKVTVYFANGENTTVEGDDAKNFLTFLASQLSENAGAPVMSVVRAQPTGFDS